MNQQLFETQWAQIRGNLRDRFSNLTEEDIKQINGRYEQLIQKLQQRYGYSRDVAEEEVRSWNFDRAAPRSAHAERSFNRTKDEDRYANDGSSFLKWLLLAGIPLLLLAGYLAHESSKTVTPTTTTTATEKTGFATTENADDRLISQNVRRALIDNRNFTSDLSNLRITTNNGVVTISGNAGTDEDRRLIIRTAEGISGVRQVINQLTVR